MGRGSVRRVLQMGSLVSAALGPALPYRGWVWVLLEEGWGAEEGTPPGCGFQLSKGDLIISRRVQGGGSLGER